MINVLLLYLIDTLGLSARALSPTQAKEDTGNILFWNAKGKGSLNKYKDYSLSSILSIILSSSYIIPIGVVCIGVSMNG